MFLSPDLVFVLKGYYIFPFAELAFAAQNNSLKKYFFLQGKDVASLDVTIMLFHLTPY